VLLEARVAELEAQLQGTYLAPPPVACLRCPSPAADPGEGSRGVGFLAEPSLRGSGSGSRQGRLNALDPVCMAVGRPLGKGL
jgi:hypothetical protein